MPAGRARLRPWGGGRQPAQKYDPALRDVLRFNPSTTSYESCGECDVRRRDRGEPVEPRAGSARRRRAEWSLEAESADSSLHLDLDATITRLDRHQVSNGGSPSPWETT
jgi:hypothetical protein